MAGPSAVMQYIRDVVSGWPTKLRQGSGEVEVTSSGAVDLTPASGQTVTVGANGLVVPSFTDATRPAAGTAGRIIFNTDDGQLNVDNGSAWTLPDGTTT